MRPAVRMGRCIARNTGDMTSPVLAMKRLMKNDLICAEAPAGQLGQTAGFGRLPVCAGARSASQAWCHTRCRQAQTQICSATID